ncbi:unnamed protein product [Psylliodes chrysocephalus]|uniref:Odorant receptor n=1 Tax=Psylliodes chrysocephalus TaxID=3402493 RepID=A0A9P0D307_9CUCU|nr:unnamed protein product [Psylliodes chrysocephala]
MFRVLCVFVVIFYGLFPILDKNPEETKKLPLPLWFPFEIDKSYYFIWFMTVLSICIGAWTNSNIDILTIMLITLATAQFEILKKRLRSIVPINDEHMDERLLMRKLKDCVIHFNDINRAIKSLKLCILPNGLNAMQEYEKVL